MGINYTTTLLSNASATGSAASVRGGLHAFAVDGTFSGATVKLQLLSPDGVSFIDVPDASFTVEGVIGVELPGGSTVKAVITGGPPSGIYATLSLVR